MLLPRTAVSWETPLGQLCKPITPNDAFYIRHHAVAVPRIDTSAYRLTISGDGAERALTLADLQALPRAGEVVTLECAGNGRTSFDPKPLGVPWGFGAIGTARWEGVRLRDILGLVPRGSNAKHIVLEAHDGPVDANIPAYRRSLPLERALGDGAIVADRMNGEPLAPAHGGPVRLIVGGWTANHSVKWLRRISFAPEVDGGYWMASEYRVPDADGVDRIIECPAPIAVIASPQEGDTTPERVQIRGVTFGHPVPAAVRLDIDDEPSRDAPAVQTLGPFAWASWSIDVELKAGEHRLRARPIDDRGRAGPSSPTWNLRGYNYDGPHSIAITVKRGR
jgi:DMSO/TMAO reductase YedYZ molybdopterin-dependent catalytic subunit